MANALLALLGGLVLLVAGGHGLVTGAAAIASRFGVSSLLVGVVVIGFGTSAPELAVSVLAAARGDAAIAVGNVTGSNVANVGLILALTCLIRPATVGSEILRREVPLLLLASGAALVMALDTPLRGQPPTFDRADGVLLLLLFAMFLYVSVLAALRNGRDVLLTEASEMAPPALPPWGAAASVLLGLGGLVWGASLAVDGATGVARAFGVSDAVIGFTVVAVGTSLPELVASSIAAARREPELAVGNVAGSNLFNVLCVLGTASTVRTCPVPAGGVADVAAALGAALALLLVMFDGRLRRSEGAVLLIGYVLYLVWRWTS